MKTYDDVLAGKPGGPGWYFHTPDTSPGSDAKVKSYGPFISRPLAIFFAAFFYNLAAGQVVVNKYTSDHIESFIYNPEEMGWASFKVADPRKARYAVLNWRQLVDQVRSGEWKNFVDFRDLAE